MSLRNLLLSICTLVLILLLAALTYFFVSKMRSEETIPLTEEQTPEEQSFIEITPENDCSAECTHYKEDQEKYNYCRAVCGLTVEEGVFKPPTSTNPELSNDYVLQEKAVKETNITECQQIHDANIKSTCQARVTEDLFEKQGGNGFE